jgi:hypothetical protein
MEKIMTLHDTEITEFERAEIEKQLAKILGEGQAETIVDPDEAAIPVDVGVEVVVRVVDEGFEDSHLHEHPTDQATVLHLQPEDAREFERQFTEEWVLPGMHKRLYEIEPTLGFREEDR